MRHIFSFFLFVLLGCCSCLVQAAERPNVVFIIADDLRFDLLGCNGHPHAQTPAIDRIAEEGANFTNFMAVTPLCSPSRASFLTGLYPHAHRIVNNDDQGLEVKSHRLMTFPRILREMADYHTAYIGKWHMGFDDSRRPGFDHWISFKGQGQFIDPVVNINGDQVQTDGYLTDLITQWGVEYLDQEHPQPFCLVLSHEATHNPFIPAARHENLYHDVKVKPTATDEQALAGKKALQRAMPDRDGPGWFNAGDASPEPGEPRRGRPDTLEAIAQDQLRCLASVDEGVRKIFEVLAKRELLDNTIVIFTSDQGFLQGEFGLRKGKRWAYDPCLRVPFMVRFPKLVEAGTTVEKMVASVDLMPTLLELAGVQWYSQFHGRSFVPLLENDTADWRDSLLLEYFEERVAPRCPQYFGVRTEEWKYIRYPQLEGMDELYHLASDPGERLNVIDHQDSQQALQQMQAELSKLNKETGNPFEVF